MARIFFLSNKDLQKLLELSTYYEANNEEHIYKAKSDSISLGQAREGRVNCMKI